MDAVTEVLLDRSQQADRLSKMVVVSLALHAMLVAAVALGPRLFPRDEDVDMSHVMTISLAGGDTVIQGRNPTSNKAVQEAVPDPSKAKNDAPPALAKPDMVEPILTKKPDPKPVAKQEPKKPEPPQLHSRTPTQGAEVKPGMARVQTNQTAAVPFGGLATGGGPVVGAYTDFGDFCCPEYLMTMQQRIYGNWQAKQGQVAKNKAKFTVQRDGTISDVDIEISAGPFLDLASRRALEQTQRLPPLPSAYTQPRLVVHLWFEYK